MPPICSGFLPCLDQHASAIQAISTVVLVVVTGVYAVLTWRLASASRTQLELQQRSLEVERQRAEADLYDVTHRLRRRLARVLLGHTGSSTPDATLLADAEDLFPQLLRLARIDARFGIPATAARTRFFEGLRHLEQGATGAAWTCLRESAERLDALSHTVGLPFADLVPPATGVPPAASSGD